MTASVGSESRVQPIETDEVLFLGGEFDGKRMRVVPIAVIRVPLPVAVEFSDRPNSEEFSISNPIQYQIYNRVRMRDAGSEYTVFCYENDYLSPIERLLDGYRKTRSE